MPGISDLAIYDRKTSTFKIVNNFCDFPSPMKIQGTKYYYSYHRSGCADSNWDSDLFTIINNNAITIGNIHGIGCGVDEKNGIYINKVKGKENKLIKFIEKEQGYWDGKWEFIKIYWTENYNKFI